jgi:hypothetical protein
VTGEVCCAVNGQPRSSARHSGNQPIILVAGQHPSAIKNLRRARQRRKGAKIAALEILKREQRNGEADAANSIHFSRELLVRLFGAQWTVRIEDMHVG